VSTSRRLSSKLAAALSRLAAAPSWLAAALTLATLLLTGPASAGIADQVGATFGMMLQDVVVAFPAVEGLVVQVDGESLYLDLARKDGVLLRLPQRRGFPLPEFGQAARPV